MRLQESNTNLRTQLSSEEATAVTARANGITEKLSNKSNDRVKRANLHNTRNAIWNIIARKTIYDKRRVNAPWGRFKKQLTLFSRHDLNHDLPQLLYTHIKEALHYVNMSQREDRATQKLVEALQLCATLVHNNPKSKHFKSMLKNVMGEIVQLSQALQLRETLISSVLEKKIDAEQEIEKHRKNVLDHRGRFDFSRADERMLEVTKYEKRYAYFQTIQASLVGAGGPSREESTALILQRRENHLRRCKNNLRICINRIRPPCRSLLIKLINEDTKISNKNFRDSEIPEIQPLCKEATTKDIMEVIDRIPYPQIQAAIFGEAEFCADRTKINDELAVKLGEHVETFTDSFKHYHLRHLAFERPPTPQKLNGAKGQKKAAASSPTGGGNVAGSEHDQTTAPPDKAHISYQGAPQADAVHYALYRSSILQLKQYKNSWLHWGRHHRGVVSTYIIALENLFQSGDLDALEQTITYLRADAVQLVKSDAFENGSLGRRTRSILDSIHDIRERQQQSPEEGDPSVTPPRRKPQG